MESALTRADRWAGRRMADIFDWIDWPALRLLPTADEVEHMTTDLSGILTHIDELNELDTTGVEPMAQVLYDSSSGLREDVERTPLSNGDALANAPSAGSGYYKVPKVIER